MSYCKFLHRIEMLDNVLLVDPMLTTRDSVKMAINAPAMDAVIDCLSRYKQLV